MISIMQNNQIYFFKCTSKVYLLTWHGSQLSAKKVVKKCKTTRLLILYNLYLFCQERSDLFAEEVNEALESIKALGITCFAIIRKDIISRYIFKKQKRNKDKIESYKISCLALFDCKM